MEMSINGFLTVPKKERTRLLKRLRVETKERIFKNTLTMAQLASLETVESYEERVKIRYKMIQKEPETLFWDYLEYLDTSGEVIRSSSMLISTKGDLVTLSNKGALYFNLAGDWDGGNKYKGIKIGKKQARTHRAVASTFIPIPENLETLDYKILEVNHKDLRKFNNAWDNLEWITRIGNVRHSHNYNDYTNYEHYLMEVIIDNGFLGRKFVINRLTEEGPYPLSFIAGSIKIGNNPSGFKVINIPKEEIDKYEQGYPKDIKALFDADKKYFQTYIKPVIGTVLIGKHRGLKFSLFGADEMNEHFNQGGILKAASGEHIQALGCSYVYCSHREGIPLRGG